MKSIKTIFVTSAIIFGIFVQSVFALPSIETFKEIYEISTTVPVAIMIDVSGDETTDLTTGTAKKTFRVPYAFTLTDVRASVTLAPTDATIEVDVNEGGTSIFSTVLSIDATELTSVTASTPAVISDSAIADNAVITIDVDQIGSTVAGDGLKIWLIGTVPN